MRFPNHYEITHPSSAVKTFGELLGFVSVFSYPGIFSVSLFLSNLGFVPVELMESGERSLYSPACRISHTLASCEKAQTVYSSGEDHTAMF